MDLIYNHSMKNQDPSQEQLQSVLNLYTHGKLQQALSKRKINDIFGSEFVEEKSYSEY